MSEPAELVPFVAATVEDAVAQVRARLGPSAVVVHVRKVPVQGKGLFKRKQQRLEILAYRPDVGGALDATSDAIAVPDSQPAAAEVEEPRAPIPPAVVHPPPNVRAPASEPPAPRPYVASAVVPAAVPIPSEPALAAPPPGSTAAGWKIGAVLQGSGFLPSHAQRVLDELRRRHGDHPPGDLGQELALTRGVLAELWRAPSPAGAGMTRPHVFVGAAGVGKTTCLCKWLTQAVLAESRSVHVWRLDGQTANTAEQLSVYCEILGVPLERTWRPEADAGDWAEGYRFIDFPGIDWRDPAAVAALNTRLVPLGSPRVHLVLNGAYEMALLLRQVRAFSALPVEDLIVTHLDEETRWGKIWNLVLGTNFSVRFLSSGQNIPGDFLPASPESIFARQFPA